MKRFVVHEIKILILVKNTGQPEAEKLIIILPYYMRNKIYSICKKQSGMSESQFIPITEREQSKYLACYPTGFSQRD